MTSTGYVRRMCNFNPRSHEGSDARFIKKRGNFMDFNPRSHEGSDFKGKKDMPVTKKFQSTLPRGERQG